MNNETLTKQLSAPFADSEIEWRVMRCGKTAKGVWAIIVPYVQSRAIMNRLDEVVGISNWKDSYESLPLDNKQGCLCQLSLRIEDEWITKTDGADYTNIEATKGGISDALKRAAVKFGIGRYLYSMPEFWARDIKEGYPDKTQRGINISSKEIGRHWCLPPSLKPYLTETKTSVSPEPQKSPETSKSIESDPELANLEERIATKGTDESPITCNFCGLKHITVGDPVVHFRGLWGAKCCVKTYKKIDDDYRKAKNE